MKKWGAFLAAALVSVIVGAAVLSNLWTPTVSAANPQTIFNHNQATGGTDDYYWLVGEVGTQFVPLVDGYITKLSYYKRGGTTGLNRSGRLWNGATMALLATQPYVNETSVGWQEVTLSSPVPVTANQLYVVSYDSQNWWHNTANYFTQEIVNGNLKTPLNAGVTSGTNGGFPTQNGYSVYNYWVDVTFEATETPSNAQCAAPTLISDSDTNQGGGGQVSIEWTSVPGVLQWAIGRGHQFPQDFYGTRIVGMTTGTSFSGADGPDDPNWQVFAIHTITGTGNCTWPGLSLDFDPQ